MTHSLHPFNISLSRPSLPHTRSLFLPHSPPSAVGIQTYIAGSASSQCCCTAALPPVPVLPHRQSGYLLVHIHTILSTICSFACPSAVPIREYLASPVLLLCSAAAPPPAPVLPRRQSRCLLVPIPTDSISALSSFSLRPCSHLFPLPLHHPLSLFCRTPQHQLR